MLKVVWVVHGDGCCLEVGRVAIGPLATKQVISFHRLHSSHTTGGIRWGAWRESFGVFD